MPHPHRHNPKLLTLIALTKLLKGTLLLIVAVKVLHLASHDVHDTLAAWARAWHFDPDGRHIHGLIERATGFSPHQLREISVGLLLYSALYLTEGVGLLLDRLWAEWLTVITTAGFIPFEIYELAARFTVVRVAVLVLNALILTYLIRRLWRRHEALRAARRATVA